MLRVVNIPIKSPIRLGNFVFIMANVLSKIENSIGLIDSGKLKVQFLTKRLNLVNDLKIIGFNNIFPNKLNSNIDSFTINYDLQNQNFEVGFHLDVMNYLCELISNSTQFNFQKKRLEKLYSIDENDVAVHIRCGDYLTLRKMYCFFDRNVFFEWAFSQLSEIKNINRIFLFSDDFKYCNNHYLKTLSEFSNQIIPVNLAEHDYQDMLMMGVFKNIILLNSTFSCVSAYISDVINSGISNIYSPKYFVNYDVKYKPCNTEWNLFENEFSNNVFL